MNIKKIIREEIEDFTWITDAPLNPWLEYDAIIFDKKPKKKKVNNYIQLALNTKNPSNKGSWETRRKEDIESILRYIKNYGEAALMVDGNNNLVYADPSYYDGKTINSIRYSQLVNKNLNESEEDGLEWMMEPINPWLQYSMLILDEEPTREEINHYIELALNTGRISNKEAWETGRKVDIDAILGYIKNDGEAVLKIDQWGDLQYADSEYYNSSHNSVRYSQLVNKNLNESEEDEWSWARNSFISSNEIKVGNKIRIHNLGDEESFLSWLGDYRDRFLDKKYGDQIEGVVQRISEWNFCLDTKDDDIYFPSDKKILDLNSSEYYKNLHIGYELI